MSAMIDPFQAAPDPALYVPRRASERAVTEFERGLFQTLEAVVVLVGPPGIGKSVVLAEVARRLDGRCTCVTVEFAELPLPELCKWVLRELEAGESGGDANGPGSALDRLRTWVFRGPTRERDPEGALVQRALELERTGRPLVVLIDDADEMDGRTAAALARLAGRAQGALFIGIATCDDRLLANAGKRSVAVLLSDPMSQDETARYITARLERSGASHELRTRLDRDSVARLHAYAQGNPRRVHGEISLIQIELDSAHQRLAGGLSEPPAGAATAALPRPTSAPVPAPARTEPTPALAEAEPLPMPTRAEATPGAEPGSARVGPVDVPALQRVPSIPAPAPVERPLAVELELTAPPSLPAEEDSEPESESRRSGVLWMLGMTLLIGALGWYMGTFLNSERALSQDRATASRSAAARSEPEPAAAAAPAAPTEVKVNINADPWADIWIDGRNVGDTPLADIPLTMGEHRFRAVFEDGKTMERTVDVDPERRFISFP